MWSARYKQGDLFEEVRIAELRPELRSRLTPLLQALLAEAAQLGSQQTSSDNIGSAGTSDD
jgi:hypothetical protein